VNAIPILLKFVPCRADIPNEIPPVAFLRALAETLEPDEVEIVRLERKIRSLEDEIDELQTELTKAREGGKEINEAIAFLEKHA
jgi:chromosome segregation ATPase